jgi:hypothetical protein
MALWKQNFLTCALVAAIAFETHPLVSYVICETVVPLPETALKLFSGISSRDVRKSLSLRGFSFSFWKEPKIAGGPSHVNKVHGPFL